MDYQPRVIDQELDQLLPALPAVAFEGAKGVGKTATASRRAETVHALDDPAQRGVARADPDRLLDAPGPVLVDEWQHLPELWDLVRRRVDAGAPAGQFLLAGSASPEASGTHSGAARIVSVRMRPMALAERGSPLPTVGLGHLLATEHAPIEGSTDWSLDNYVAAIVGSGFPGLLHLSGRPLRSQLDGYIRRVVDRDFPELGVQLRNPSALLRWMRAYAAASSTTAKYETIRDAATSGAGEKPARTSTQPYRDVLERLWILDPVPAWSPTGTHIRRLTLPPKHQLADPALAARLLGVDGGALLSGAAVGPPIPRDGTLLGALFESLVTLSVRVYAQAAEAEVFHLRTGGGDHEIDLIVQRGDGRVIAIEVKLARDVEERDLRHLKWLGDRIGDELLDAAVVTTGAEAYRRPDGIAVIPAALLGP
jgi:predicted AAA+ superfamily ATPase